MANANTPQVPTMNSVPYNSGLPGERAVKYGPPGTFTFGSSIRGTEQTEAEVPVETFKNDQLATQLAGFNALKKVGGEIRLPSEVEAEINGLKGELSQLAAEKSRLVKENNGIKSILIDGGATIDERDGIVQSIELPDDPQVNELRATIEELKAGIAGEKELHEKLIAEATERERVVKEAAARLEAEKKEAEEREKFAREKAEMLAITLAQTNSLASITPASPATSPDKDLENIVFLGTGESIPSPKHIEEKVGNMDSFFVDTENGSIGVMDGVGSTANGASAFVSGRLQKCLAEMPDGRSEDETREEIISYIEDIRKELVATLWNSAQKNGTENGTNTTAVFAKVFTNDKGKKKLFVGNIGDSRIWVVRNGKVIYTSADQKAGSNPDQTEKYNNIVTKFAEKVSRVKNIGIEEARHLVLVTAQDIHDSPDGEINIDKTLEDIGLLKEDWAVGDGGWDGFKLISRKVGSHAISNSCADKLVTKKISTDIFDIEDKDTVLAFSDGVGGSFYKHEILELLEKYPDNPEQFTKEIIEISKRKFENDSPNPRDAHSAYDDSTIAMLVINAEKVTTPVAPTSPTTPLASLFAQIVAQPQPATAPSPATTPAPPDNNQPHPSRSPHDAKIKVIFRRNKNKKGSNWWIEESDGKTPVNLKVDGNIDRKEWEKLEGLLRKYRAVVRDTSNIYPDLTKIKDRLLDDLERGKFNAVKNELRKLEKELKSPTKVAIGPMAGISSIAQTPAVLLAPVPHPTPIRLSDEDMARLSNPVRSDVLENAQNFSILSRIFPREDNGVFIWYEKKTKSSPPTPIPAEKMNGTPIGKAEWEGFSRLFDRYKKLLNTELSAYSRSASLSIKNELLQALGTKNKTPGEIKKCDFNLARKKKLELEEELRSFTEIEKESRAKDLDRWKAGPAKLELETWQPEFIKEMGIKLGKLPYALKPLYNIKHKLVAVEWKLIEGEDRISYEIAKQTIQLFRNEYAKTPEMVARKNKILERLNALDFPGAKLAAEEYEEVFYKPKDKTKYRTRRQEQEAELKVWLPQVMAESEKRVAERNAEIASNKNKKAGVLRPGGGTYKYKTGKLWKYEPSTALNTVITNENKKVQIHPIGDDKPIDLEEWVAKGIKENKEKEDARAIEKLKNLADIEKKHREMYARNPVGYRKIYLGDENSDIKELKRGKVFASDDPTKEIVQKILNENGGGILPTQVEAKNFATEDLKSRNQGLWANSQNYSPIRNTEKEDPNEQARRDSHTAKEDELGRLIRPGEKSTGGLPNEYTHISDGDRLASPLTRSFPTQGTKLNTPIPGAVTTNQLNTDPLGRIEPGLGTVNTPVTPAQNPDNSSEKENKQKAVTKALSSLVKNRKTWGALATAAVVLGTLTYMHQKDGAGSPPVATAPSIPSPSLPPSAPSAEKAADWQKYLQTDDDKEFLKKFTNKEISDDSLISEYMPISSSQADSWRVFNDTSGKIIEHVVDGSGISHRDEMSKYILFLTKIRGAIFASQNQAEDPRMYPTPNVSIKQFSEDTRKMVEEAA